MNIQDLIMEYKSELVSALIGSLATVFLIGVFIGRDKLTWLIRELVKMYSAHEKSYFSKKRIESGIAYIVFQHGMLFWLARKYGDMSTTDFLMWATLEAAISGWYVSQIQKEKVTNNAGSKPTEKQDSPP